MDIPQAIYDRTARCEACLFAQPYADQEALRHAMWIRRIETLHVTGGLARGRRG